jgi:S-adenosylmethionine:tRNA ribosyltransferase-isomerase
LHFTSAVLEQLRRREIEIVEITHHVGYATFQPIRVDKVEDHRIGSESFEISVSAAETINDRRRSGGRVIAIGTTTVRALESSVVNEDTIGPRSSSTTLFIYPGYGFRAIDGLLTNFHLPGSSLLMLVSALAGRDLILEAYRHAVDLKYRFYSYGDCMLII